jgi:hypothetical protein
MFRTIIATAALASATLTGIAATPAAAQEGYRYTESYQGDDGSYYRNETYREGYRGDYDSYRGGYDRQAGYERGDYYRGGNYNDARGYYRDQRGYAYAPPPRRGYQRCSDGTTGTILGAALGGLLGREVGRGGRWNRPSGTGLILGAAGGALAGRAIERDDCR